MRTLAWALAAALRDVCAHLLTHAWVAVGCVRRSVEGLNYGYHNMLWGWIDTIKDNYPCVPPYPVTEDSKCLTWELVETLFSVLNKAIPALGDLLFKQVGRARRATPHQ